MNKSQAGLTYLELVVVIFLLMVLAAAAIPMTRWDKKRRMETELRSSLLMMREAIDKYKQYVDEGLIIQEDVEQMGYPLDLDVLVEGVEIGDPNSLDTRTVRFLRTIPVDPFTGEPEWGKRSFQDDWDSESWGGENVYDVYSLSDLRALDDTYYREW